MDVSIILVSYNTKDLTRNCLKSVYEQTRGVNFEIFVVDNNSHDGSQEMIEKEFPQVKLIRNSENKGFGAANNIAIKQSNAKYILCLNTDTILLNNAVKIFFDFMEKTENQNVGVCGGQLFNQKQSPTYSVGNYPSLSRVFFTFLGLKYIFPQKYRDDIAPAKIVHFKKPTSVEYVTGADIFFRKSVLNTVGIFDENIFMYGEESDICFRIKKSGFDIIFLPEAKIIHLEGGSSASLAKAKIVQTSLLYWYKKNVSLLAFYLHKSCLILFYFGKFLYTCKKENFNMFIYFLTIQINI